MSASFKSVSIMSVCIMSAGAMSVAYLCNNGVSVMSLGIISNISSHFWHCWDTTRQTEAQNTQISSYQT